jgi:hypothetical protein
MPNTAFVVVVCQVAATGIAILATSCSSLRALVLIWPAHFDATSLTVLGLV